MTTTDTARKYYLLTTDDNPTPRIADFAALFPDGLEAGTTSEEVAALAPADLYHAGTWAVVACDLEILDAARDADDILADVRGAPAELADDETLAAAYLADRRANRERALVAANVRQLGPGPAAAADVRAAAAELEQLGMFVDQLELVPGFMPRAPARARTVGKLRALADRLAPRPSATVRELADACNRLAAIVEPPRDEAALLALAQLLAGAAPGEVEIDALDVDGALVAPLRWNGAAWVGRVGDITPPRRIDGFRFRRPGAYPSTVRARDIDLTGGLRGSVGAADLVDLKLGFTMPDGTAWPEIVVDSASLPRAVARFRGIVDAPIQAAAGFHQMLTGTGAAIAGAPIRPEIAAAAAHERDVGRAVFVDWKDQQAGHTWTSGDFAIGDDRGGPPACECGAPYAPHPGAPGEHTRTCDCDDVETDAPDDGGGRWERRQLGIDS